MTSTKGNQRILVVVDAWGETDGLLREIEARLDPAAEVLVLAPALAGVVDSFYGDVDAQRVRTEERLAALLGGLERHGIQAQGEVGDEDPAHAVWDVMNAITLERNFVPDEIILVTRDRKHENWREHGLAQRLSTAYGVHVQHVVLSAGESL